MFEKSSAVLAVPTGRQQHGGSTQHQAHAPVKPRLHSISFRSNRSTTLAHTDGGSSDPTAGGETEFRKTCDRDKGMCVRQQTRKRTGQVGHPVKNLKPLHCTTAPAPKSVSSTAKATDFERCGANCATSLTTVPLKSCRKHDLTSSN